jgi:hypothetical protein
MSSIFAPMKIDDIGSGRAERRIKINGTERIRGDELSHADLASMATANRNALIENRFITVFPKSVQVRGGLGAAGPAVAAVEGEFHVVARGFGKYDVIKGVVLLAEATKDAAAEFVATEQAKAPKGAQAATAGPGEAQPKRQASGTKKKPKKRKRSGAGLVKPPAPGAQGDNGPIE